MDEKERRAFTGPVEIREEDGKKIIRGYAAVFDSPTTIAGWFDEEIAPGTFDRALKEKQDVRCLTNHNPDLLLGRTKSGTLTLGVDDHGLWYEDEAPDNNAGRDALESIGRGDMSGSSFGFYIRKQEWIEEEGKQEKRIIKDVDLFDVSPVTFPAYKDTEVALRAQYGTKEKRTIPGMEDTRTEETPDNDDTTTEERERKQREARARVARLRVDELE